MLKNLTIAEELYRSPRVVVVRAWRSTDQTHVVLKMIPATTMDPLAAAKLRHERDMLDAVVRLGCAGVPQCLEILNDEGRTILMLEDIGGVSLEQVHRQRPLSVGEVLRIALQVANTLGVVHRARIVHKDINPSNVVYNRSTGRAQLIDFGIASQLSHETQTTDSLRSLEGTPAYLPPEQTGRTSRAVDHRADFYALGATLYALLGGVPPFAQHDLADLVYNILTTVPVPLVERNSDVPAALSAVVARLMAKTPEERYQSVHGIVHDLERCQQAMSQGNPQVFPLGELDRDETLTISQHLYGRDTVVRGLQSVYDSAQQDGVRCVMLRGVSGIGKSSIMQQLQPRILAGHGIYLSGKHDQLQRHVAFGAFRQAIDMLVRQILKEPSDIIAIWKYRLQAALGRIGRPLLDLVPSLQNLIGPQPPLAELGPRETENRFLSLLESFVRALIADQPLVLFLDDLQWADSGTLKLVQIIATTPEQGKGLLLVGAYRSNEVDEAHPLALCLDAIRQTGITSEFEVGPLAVEDVAHLLADTTRRTLADVSPLADLLWRRSAGNPFFIHELLKYLWDRQLLNFDAKVGALRWDIAAIGDAGLPGNVVDLVADKIRSLGTQQARVISYAACIGDVAPLSLLATTLGMTSPDVLLLLQAVLEASLLIPYGPAYRYAAHSGEEVYFKFTHDRIRQAALELLPGAEAQALHLSAARHLRGALEPNPAPASLFEVVEHYHAAADCVVDPTEQADVLNLSMRAAHEARRAVAYGAARRCLDTAALLRDRLGLPASDAQAAAIEAQRAELDMLGGDHAAAMQRLDSLLRTITDPLERGRIQTRRITILMDQGKPRVAMDVCSEALRELGYAGTESSANLLGNGLRLLARIGKPRAGMFLQLGECTDPRALVALAILSEGGTAAHECGAKAFLGTSILMNLINLQHGRSVYSAQAVLNLCIISCVMNNYVAVREFGIAANQFFEAGGIENAAGCAFARAMFLSHLDMGPAELSQVLQNAHQIGRETGNATFAMWSALGAIGYTVHASVDAALSLHELYRAYFASRRGSPQYDAYHDALMQLARALRGETANPHTLADANFDEIAAERYAAANPQDSAGIFFRLWSLMLRYVHDDLSGAYAFATRMLADGALRTLTDASVPTFCFYCGLTLMAHAAANQKTRAPRALRPLLAKLRALAATAPESYSGELALFEAELAALAGNREQAIRKYGEACALLSASGWMDRRAVAARRAGGYFAAIGLHAVAQVFAQEACSLFEAWGAKVAAARLRASLSAAQGQRLAMATRPTVTTKLATTDLDVRALMNFAHAISSEVKIERLLETLLSVLKEAAGASRAVLLFVESGGLRPVADTASPQQSVPERLTQYVARTKEPVLLPDVARPGDFADPHFSDHEAKSAVAVPVIYRGEVRAVAYLENSVSSAVFSSARLMILEFLAAQAATALENVTAQANLDRIVTERTQDIERAHANFVAMQRDSTEMQMAGGFAHEMRNAISGAHFAVSALKRTEMTPEGLASQDVRELLEVIERGLERGQQVIASVLAYADASTLVPPRSRTDVAELLRALFVEHQGAFTAQGITAQMQTGSTELAMDHEHASTILRILLSNACDALATRPADQRNLMVRTEVAHRGTLVCVEDSGAGVSDAASQLLFTPFYSTKGAQGSGLGLALSRKLARAYGGDLAFSPREGGGASFRLLVPDRGKLPSS